MEEVIGSVAYCSIEQDRVTQYPKGAACVIFSTKESYIKAIAIHELVLRFSEGDRKVIFIKFNLFLNIHYNIIFRWRLNRF